MPILVSAKRLVWSREEVVDFLESIQATGRPFGVKVDVASVSNEKVSAHARIALSLAARGSFQGVMRTLGAIEYGPYDGVITNLSLTTDSPSTVGSTTSTTNEWNATTLYSVGLRATSTPVVATSTKP